MAISAKMLQYRGSYENFRPSVLLPGQFAVVLSGDPNTTTGKAVYMCFETGKATRILADGDVVSGGGVSDAQIAEAVENYLANNPIEYELPVANANTLGGVKPVAKTDAMTQPVGVDAEGKLFTAPGGSGGSVSWNDILDRPFYSTGLTIEWDGSTEGRDFVDMGEIIYYKVSDATPSYEGLKNCSAVLIMQGQESTLPDGYIAEQWETMISVGGVTDDFAMTEAFIVSNKDNLDVTTQVGMTFHIPSKGLYLPLFPDGLGYVKTLSIGGEIVPLPIEYVPYFYTKEQIDEMFANFSGTTYPDAEGVAF